MVRVISFVGHDSGTFFTVRTRCFDDKGNDPITDAIFFSYEEARNHVTLLRRKWLLESFKDYVQHKLILFKTSYGDYYRVPSRLDILTRLENAIKVLPQNTTKDICLMIIRSESLLRAVLPHSANQSYETQDAKISQMLMVADNEITGKLGIFPFKSTHKAIYYI